ncbi:hypothetical protein G0U57_017452 [Chelydra serpentina]|uniref:RNase H type-1 domain-containing protein n=1 Tax=Chelydra serpentina TaxID=8475 RepID=A0A8T1THU9_CHESE|nr:hypothetical protein G0U57_017452 [Chelydra serpentina]
MGYVAVRISDEKVFKGQCLPQSVQAAKMVAVIVALENMPRDEAVAIFTDSDWVLRAAIDWIPLLGEEGYEIREGKPISYAEKLIYLWGLAQQRT